MRTFYLLGFAWVALCAATVLLPGGEVLPLRHAAPPGPVATDDAGRWFQQMRPYCNPVEVEVRHRWSPPPGGLRGSALSAACWALAGRIDEARAALNGLPEVERWRAAGVVFAVGHPVADAGDDRAAGPIMELVVEFWPNHAMALYHAGASRYALGDPEPARRYLRRFLDVYEPDDGWRRSAVRILEELGEP